MPTEADTCRRLVVPKLQAASWDNEPYSIAEQRTITDGRIVPVGKGFVRRPPKPPDRLAASILEKEKRIAEIMTNIRTLLPKQ
jgi:hypothetical protein